MTQASHSVQTYRTIRERILSLEAEIDETTLADTLEGVTDLHEVLAAIVRSALIDEAMASGLKDHIHCLQERLGRLTERASERRRLARDAMLEVDIRKITAPDFSVSLRPGPVALRVLDEAAIPPPYWEPREPRLNRLALLNDLKKGLPIAGAQLSNPEPVLSVRVK